MLVATAAAAAVVVVAVARVKRRLGMSSGQWPGETSRAPRRLTLPLTLTIEVPFFFSPTACPEMGIPSFPSARCFFTAQLWIPLDDGRGASPLEETSTT